jgi:hypothetical protein
VNMGASYLAGATQALVVLQQPFSQTAGLTSNLTLRVTAMGAPPIFYQWRFNNLDIAGATASTYTVTNLTAARQGAYQVLASNREASINSAQAVTLLDNPVRINYTTTPACPFNLRLSGPAGKSFILQTTTNLTTWTSLWTNPAPTGILEFNDAAMINTRARFYRTVSIP